MVFFLNVFLDDTRPCPRGFRLARTAKACMRFIARHRIKVLSLDHDLGYEKPTGYDVAQYIVRTKRYADRIIIHSANPVGSVRMFMLLSKHKPRHVRLEVKPRPYRL